MINALARLACELGFDEVDGGRAIALALIDRLIAWEPDPLCALLPDDGALDHIAPRQMAHIQACLYCLARSCRHLPAPAAEWIGPSLLDHLHEVCGPALELLDERLKTWQHGQLGWSASAILSQARPVWPAIVLVEDPDDETADLPESAWGRVIALLGSTSEIGWLTLDIDHPPGLPSPETQRARCRWTTRRIRQALELKPGAVSPGLIRVAHPGARTAEGVAWDRIERWTDGELMGWLKGTETSSPLVTLPWLTVLERACAPRHAPGDNKLPHAAAAPSSAAGPSPASRAPGRLSMALGVIAALSVAATALVLVRSPHPPPVVMKGPTPVGVSITPVTLSVAGSDRQVELGRGLSATGVAVPGAEVRVDRADLPADRVLHAWFWTLDGAVPAIPGFGPLVPPWRGVVPQGAKAFILCDRPASSPIDIEDVAARVADGSAHPEPAWSALRFHLTRLAEEAP